MRASALIFVRVSSDKVYAPYGKALCCITLEGEMEACSMSNNEATSMTDEHPITQCLDENGDFSFEKFAALLNSGEITISKQNMFEPEEEE